MAGTSNGSGLRRRLYSQRRHHELQLDLVRDKWGATLGAHILKLGSLTTDLGNCSAYLHKVERLADYRVDEVRFSIGRRCSGPITRHEHNIHVGPALADFASSFPSIHLWHRQISKHQIET